MHTEDLENWREKKTGMGAHSTAGQGRTSFLGDATLKPCYNSQMNKIHAGMVIITVKFTQKPFFATKNCPIYLYIPQEMVKAHTTCFNYRHHYSRADKENTLSHSTENEKNWQELVIYWSLCRYCSCLGIFVKINYKWKNCFYAAWFQFTEIHL